MAVIAGYLLWRAVTGLLRRNPEARWIPAPGQITRSRVQKSGRDYEADVSYKYTYEGATRTGDGITPLEWFSSIRWFAAQIAKRYHEGQEVTVYVNPAKPHKAVLERYITRKSALLAIFSAALVAGFVYITVRAWFE